MKIKTKRIAGKILIAVLIGVMTFAGIKLGCYFEEKERTEQAFQELSLLSDTDHREAEKKYEPEDAEKLAHYQKLHEQNPDFAGWIWIEGTNIDYPVMQSPENPEFYLDHGFDKEYSSYGVPFADAACDMKKSNNFIIYGHHMNNETMFHEITYYKDPDFLKNHPKIQFDTMDHCGEYEVIAAFCYDVENDCFRFNRHTDMSMNEFAEFIRCVHERELYNTGLTAVYGDQLLTLSTCDYVYSNGRFVVVAREVR